MKISPHRAIAAAGVAAVAVLLAACGGGSAGGTGGGGGSVAGPTTTSVTSDAKRAPTLAEANGAKGTVTFCVGNRASDDQKAAAQAFNARYASRGLRMRLLELPGAADEQFVQRQRARSGECDVFYSDVTWTAQLASQRWLLDMSDYVNERKSEFIPSTLSTTKYDGKYWGVPQQTDAAFLYYRTDKVPQVPTTWQEVYAEAEKQGGIVYQGAAYDGLTSDYLELAFAAGGTVLSPDGKQSEIDSAQNVKALQLMVDGVKSGAAPKAVTTYREEESRRAFESGGPAFMRNWSYAYALDQQAPRIKGRFKVVPLPSFDGGLRRGVLRGHNLVISAYSGNPTAAVLAVDYLTSRRVIKANATRFSLAPVLKATYDDRAVQKALPFATKLEQAVAHARTRPISPAYPQISRAIYENVNAALSGRISAQDALKQADGQIGQALKGS
jgi:multiple sugar transport system substrate-binding protein